MQFSKAGKVFFETLQLRPHASFVGLSSGSIRKKLIFPIPYSSKICHSARTLADRQRTSHKEITLELLQPFSIPSNLLSEAYVFLSNFKDIIFLIFT